MTRRLIVPVLGLAALSLAGLAAWAEEPAATPAKEAAAAEAKAPTPLEAAVERGDMAAVEALKGTPEDLGRAYNNSLALKEPRKPDGTVSAVSGFGVRTINLRNLGPDRKLSLYDGPIPPAQPAAPVPAPAPEAQKP